MISLTMRLVPTEADLIASGPYSTSVAVFGSAGTAALEWLATNLPNAVNVGLALSRVAQRFDAKVCTEEAIGVGKWRWDSAEPALLDVAGYESQSPWTLDAETQHPMRVELLGNPERQQVMAVAAPQLAGRRTALCLPGGLVVDDVVRRVVAEASATPPAPWSSAAEFRAWLAPRYWTALHEHRRDLWAAFPDPEGRSASEYQRWCRGAFSFDTAPMLLVPPALERSQVVVADELRGDGLNMVGYLHASVRPRRRRPSVARRSHAGRGAQQLGRRATDRQPFRWGCPASRIGSSSPTPSAS